MDGLDKTMRGLTLRYRQQPSAGMGILFPEPGFGVPEWQARTYGYTLHSFQTSEEHHFKLTGPQLEEQLQAHSDIQLVYLTISNNPTAFAFNAEELRSLYDVLRRYWQAGRDIIVLADLAYIGTSTPEIDRERMTAFHDSEIMRHTIFVSSLSKTSSLTGERFGWVTCPDPAIARLIAASWTNGAASLPGEWQLRFMAYHRLLQQRPWLIEKLRAFYRLRRSRFIEQLHQINNEQKLFSTIYIDDDTTVYNWSKLAPGEDAFSLFEKTGIAGVPGSGFGYSDEYIRFSIGFLPVPATISAPNASIGIADT
jgi:aspartate/methionine/tyrosine aminotransferase